MAEPRTEAGRRLLAALHGLGGDNMHVLGCRWEGQVLAVEKQAGAVLDLERLRDALVAADRKIGVPIETDAELDHYTAMAIEVIREYAQLTGVALTSVGDTDG